MTKTQEEQLLKAIQKLSREAEDIRKALERLANSKTTVAEIPDLETYFEQREGQK